MKNFLYHYLICLTTLLIIDSIWLASTINILYKKHIGHLLATHPNWSAASAFYVLYALGVTFFILHPGALGLRSKQEVFMHGAFFGFIAYATYDLTNHAVLKNWPLIITVIDMLWGATLTGLISIISLQIINHFK